MRASTLSVIAVAGVANAATYNLVQFASGQGFIDSFYFIGGWNTTINDQAWNWWNSGDDFLTNVTQARQKNMLSILDNGNVKLGVDTVPQVVYNSKRHSFRLESRRKYGFNTVFVFDATHMPSGCAMWPAYWTTADNWPAGGEIDIMENVNLRTNNQIVFHTGGQCTMQRVPDQITGQQVLDDCQHYPDNNAGCAVRDPNNASFGSGFNAAQGGIYVTEFTSAAINVWFFGRGSIPSGLDTNSNATTIDTATLGRPVAILTSHAGCNIEQEFAEQKIIINTSLCGNFAGDTPVLNDSGCPVPTGQSCYSQFVAGATNPADFSQAYFEIVSHRVFQASGASSSAAEPDGPAETATSGGGSGSSSGSGNPTNSNGLPNPTGGPDAADKTALSGGLLGTALAALLALIM